MSGHTCRCVICGGAFTHAKPNANACSDKCRKEKRKRDGAACRARIRAAEKKMPEEKRCGYCEKTLPAAAFGKNAAKPDGLQSFCRECRGAYERTPTQRARQKARLSAWYLDHYEREREQARRRYAENREAMLAAYRRRYAADPEAANKTILRRDRRRRWEAQEGRRCVCGRAIDPEGERWFCRVACKAALIRRLRAAGLSALLRRVVRESERPRIDPEDVALIQGIARKTASLWAKKGTTVEDGDLVSAAMHGAWRAWLSFDPGRGTKLSTWLIYGARGEIMETLRQADILSRTERRDYKAKLKEDPNALPPVSIVSLDAILELTERDEASPLFVDPEAERVYEERIGQIDAERAAERIYRLFRPGEERMREVLQLHGAEGLSLADAGKRLGVSDSLVFELYRKAKETVIARWEGGR